MKFRVFHQAARTASLLHRPFRMAFAALCFSGGIQAGQVTLTWNPVAGAAGYEVHYGTASRAYSASMDAGKATTMTVGGLADGKRYYFVVKAYSSAATSGPSNEASAVVTASTTAPAPSFTINGTSESSLSVAQGQTINLADTSTGTVASRLWKLGDGTTATSPTVIKSYSTVGTKTVELTVTEGGVTKTASKTINVTAPSAASGSSGSSASASNRSADGSASGINIAVAMEVAELEITNQWLRVTFKSTFANPIVVAGPLSSNGGEAAVVRVRGVDATGFWIRAQEWDNGAQPYETVSYMVMERGRHQLPDGAWVEADRLVTAATNTFVSQSFSEPLYETPVVLTTVTSFNEVDTVTTRLRNITTHGFEIGLQEQEANKQQHLPESIDYIAFEPSFGVVNGMRYEVGLLGAGLTDTPQTLLYQGAYDRAPLLLADMQSANGMDTANLRWRDRNEASLELRVSEEQSKDAETAHGEEAVGYLLLERP